MASARPKPAAFAAELGARVRALRLEHGWSQEGLADRCGLHWTYVGSVERGERNLSLLNILRLAAALGVDAAELVSGLRPPKDSKRSHGI